jgi:hypothetical protein
MLKKKDAIFWSATGIFLLSAIIAEVTQNQLWLFLMIASYLLRPTLASLGFARRSTDERQMSIQYRSGNIAFAVMMIASVSLAVWEYSKGDHAWEMFNIVILLGLATKALFNVLLVKDYREVGSRIIMAVGMLVTLFVAAENGPTLGGLVESAPWLIIVGIGWAAKKYPRPVAILVFVVTAVLLFVILSKGIKVGQIATALLVCTPLAVAGVCLILPERGEIGVEHPSSDRPAS